MAALRLAVAFSSPGSCRRVERRSVVASAAGPQGAGPPPPLLPQLTRRQLQAAVLAAVMASQAPEAQALGFTKEKKKKVPLEDYSDLAAEPRLRYYDLVEGRGDTAAPGSRVVVHFDCRYRSLTVVSTRSARVLGGNRVVAEPFEFIVGQPVTGAGARKSMETAGGLYTGGGPKPPSALSAAVIGMREGGKRSLIIPAELGYGSVGEQEIPPDCPSFELVVDLLNIV